MDTSNIRSLTPQETQSVSGGVVFIIPPAVGFVAKVTGISLGIITSSVITLFALNSGVKAAFPEHQNKGN